MNQDFLFYHEKDTAPKSLMVERTRAIRHVLFCDVDRALLNELWDCADTRKIPSARLLCGPGGGVSI